MLDLERLANLQFGMSEVPKIGGQPGTYEEKWGQADAGTRARNDSAFCLRDDWDSREGRRKEVVSHSGDDSRR